MEKIDRKLLIRDVSSRIPYGVKAEVQGWNEEKQEEVYVPLTVYSINTDGYVYFESNDYDVNYCRIEDCSYYLRPMSSMTEEEKKEYNLLTPIVEVVFPCDAYPLIDWLNKKHFDYRGLIDKGLAIEITKDNNPYKE